MPTVDIEPRNSINMCDYDIFHDEDNNNTKQDCGKTVEFSPVKVDPNKLKKYVVPYIEMTHEDLKAGTEE